MAKDKNTESQEAQTQKAAAEAAAENSPESRKVAEHGYVGPDGSPVDSIDEATGISYLHVRDKWNFTYQIPGAVVASPATLLAVFGAKTLATNTTSGARQRGEDEQKALVDRFSSVDEGTWRERSEGGGRGPKYDKDVLAGVLFAALKADGVAKGDEASYREKLEDRSYYAKVRNNPKVMAAYLQEMAKRGESTAAVESLA